MEKVLIDEAGLAALPKSEFEPHVCAGAETATSGHLRLGRQRLRVALVAGTLVRGGAEKQLVYIAQALSQSGADVRVYSATRGEPYEEALRSLGVPVYWFGQAGNPLSRLVVFAKSLRSFRPHVIQSGHTFTNLYAAVAGWSLNAISLGAQRSDWVDTLESNGLWTYPHMKLPSAVITNSEKARREFVDRRILKSEAVCVLPNAIDVNAYSCARPSNEDLSAADAGPVALFVARLIPRKRLDRFVKALALATRRVPSLKGIVVGDGPERQPMQQLARDLGLSASRLSFLGERDDVSVLLHKAQFLVLSSDWEGVPNVILEAMAARLPVVTTPVGDAANVVVDGVTGYVVGFDDIEHMAARMVELAQSPPLRSQLGEAAQMRVRQHYGTDGLADRLLAIYREVAQKHDNDQLLEVLPARV